MLQIIFFVTEKKSLEWLWQNLPISFLPGGESLSITLPQTSGLKNFIQGNAEATAVEN